MVWLATVAYWNGSYGILLIQNDEKCLYRSRPVEVITPDTVGIEIARIAETNVTNVKYYSQKNYQRGYRRGQCVFKYLVLEMPDNPPF